MKLKLKDPLIKSMVIEKVRFTQVAREIPDVHMVKFNNYVGKFLQIEDDSTSSEKEENQVPDKSNTKKEILDYFITNYSKPLEEIKSLKKTELLELLSSLE